jgi:diguanylate cyclase (GGDEF)-like protein/PAS domain S-box-containing protein
MPDCLIGFSTDITSMKSAEVAVARSEARFRVLFEASSEVVVVIDRTRFLDRNESALRLLGVRNRAELLELKPADLSPDRQPCGTPSERRAAELIDQVFKEGNSRFEWLLRRHDNGDQFPVEAVVTAVELDDDHALLTTIRDLTERRRYEEQINRLAYYDALTQLPNRRLLYDRVSQAMVQHRRSNQHGCVIYLDLDNFKPLNDRHGHVAGDYLLQEVDRRLVARLRTQDTVARLGGDEFAVLLIELDKSWDVAVKQATHVAEEILDDLARPYVLRWRNPAVL